MARGIGRKDVTVWCASLSRYLWMPMVVIPFLPIPSSAKLTLFFSFLGLSTLLGQMAGAAWTDWMSDMVPESQRGRYFGFRNAVTAAVGMAVMGGGSRYLDAVPEAQRQWGFVALIALAMLGAIGSQVALSRQPDPPVVRLRPQKAPIHAPLANRAFMRMTGLMLLWTLVISITGPFCYAYALNDLHAGIGLVGLHALIVSALPIVAGPWWGKLIDRKGPQFALVLAMLPVSLHPLYWLVMRPDFLWPIWLDAFSSGLFWTGVSLATTTLLMEAAPSGERAGYVGVYSTATGIASALSALVGGLLLSQHVHDKFMIGAFSLSAWQLMLLICLGARFACVAALSTLPKLKAPTLLIETWPGGVPEGAHEHAVPSTGEAAPAT
jgi:MFS family permease